jgi:hypothetical protein
MSDVSLLTSERDAAIQTTKAMECCNCDDHHEGGGAIATECVNPRKFWYPEDQESLDAESGSDCCKREPKGSQNVIFDH